MSELAHMDIFSETDGVDLIRLRYSLHQINEMLKTGHFKQIPIHLAFGHEAVAVGVDRTMSLGDVLCVSHRNAAFNLVRSKSLESALDHYRMVARQDRVAHMASMNLADDNTGIVYASSILGNNLALAAGIAMNRKLVERAGIVFVATGDGALEEGVFWETLIFARSHALGLIVVIENNDCSMSSSILERRSPVDLSLVCAGLGVNYHAANGALLPDVVAVLSRARDAAVRGQPAIVELNISSFCQHAGPTPGWPGDPRRIALEDGLLFGNDSGDPLVHLHKAIGTGEFDRLADLVIRESSH
jgi:TPP-dependent pyruvate/acetoin dehydrogenase alpha subunit